MYEKIKCPECGAELEIENTSINGEPTIIEKCTECNYMRIKDGRR